MTTQVAIPASPEHVTAAWLTATLRGCGALETSRVVGLTVELVESQGAAAVVARIVPQYDRDEPDAPASLVAKFASPHEPIRGLLQAIGGYTREVEFYRHFGDDAGIPIPRCYHAAADPCTGTFALLLEDMGCSRMADGMEPSVEDTATAIRHLAAFHAKWWNHPRLRELEFLHYPGGGDDAAYLEMGRNALGSALPATRDRFGSSFPPSLDALATVLVENFDQLIVRRHSGQSDAITLVHGDFHPGQMFFPGPEGGRFAVYDWQTVGAGNGGDDLARIICTGLTPELQVAADRQLIALYHDGLRDAGVEDFDAASCYDAFRLGLVTSVVVNIIAAVNIDPAMIEAAEEAGEINVVDAMFGRLAAAAERHDVHAALRE